MLKPFSATVRKRGLECSSLSFGLSDEDCLHMSNIGMAGQGDNAASPTGNIWIGDDGPNTLNFTNQSGGPITVIVWDAPLSNYVASFVNVRQPKISYSLPSTGNWVSVSVENGVSGGWSALVNGQTQLSQYGQIDNTWGEFTTGNYATVDISREVNMSGTQMSARTSGGCISDMDTCVFVCKSGNTCGEAGSYTLQNCQPGSQPGATYGEVENNPTGGCQGWSNGGHIDISLGA
jgi:hypothetical protein